MLPPTSSEFFRQRAEEVERLARGMVRFDHEREAMLKIAEQWWALAKEAEAREGNRRG